MRFGQRRHLVCRLPSGCVGSRHGALADHRGRVARAGAHRDRHRAPAGLPLEKEAIDSDLRRRQQGYGRSPRQKLESDEVEVLSGLRHGVTLGTPLTLVVRNRDHANWTWGMSPWPAEAEPSGKGTKPVTLPRPGHADLAGVLKYGHDDVRNALERASARHTAVHVAAGAVAKALLRELGIEVAGTPMEIGGETTEQGMRDATDAATEGPRHARR